MADQYGVYRVGTRHRALVQAIVTFETAAGNPTVISDASGVLVATGTKVTRDAAGTFTLNLRHDWNGIFPQVQALSTTDDDSAVVEAVVTTAGANTVTVRTEAAGVADDRVGDVVQVLLTMSLSDDV